MQNLYNINKETSTASDNATFIDVGIHDGIVMTEVKYSKTVNGNEFLAFYFVNNHGDKLSHTEWPVKLSMPLDSMSEVEREKMLGIIESQKSRVKQIIEVYKGDFEIEAGNFKEFAEKTIEFLGEAYKDKPVRVKVVYDYKGYTTLPNRSRYTFIEPMSVPKEDSKIRILTGDVIIRPKKDNEQEDVLGTSGDNTPTDKKEDLPF